MDDFARPQLTNLGPYDDHTALMRTYIYIYIYIQKKFYRLQKSQKIDGSSGPKASGAFEKLDFGINNNEWK